MKELLFKLGIAIVIILGFVGYRSYLVSSYDREIRDLQLRLAESVEPVDVRFIHDTVKVFEQKVVEVDRTDYKQHLADRDEIKALGLRVSELEHENRMLYALRDTVYLTPSDDSLMIYSDEWSTFRYDRSLCQLEWEVRDSLTTYVSRYNESYLDTAAGQNLVRRAKDYAKENWRKAAGAQAVAGGTDAATAQAKEAGNRLVGDTIANIAATDAQRKDNVDNQHRQAQQQYAQMDIARENQRAQNITNAAQGASNAMMAGAMAYSQQGNNTTNLAGGNNKGIVTDVGGSMDAMRLQAEADRKRLFGEG